MKKIISTLLLLCICLTSALSVVSFAAETETAPPIFLKLVNTGHVQYNEQLTGIRVFFQVDQAACLSEKYYEIGAVVGKVGSDMTVDENGALVTGVGQVKVPLFREGKQVGNVYAADENSVTYTVLLKNIANKDSLYDFVAYAIEKADDGTKTVSYSVSYKKLSYTNISDGTFPYNYFFKQILDFKEQIAAGETVTGNYENALARVSEYILHENNLGNFNYTVATRLNSIYITDFITKMLEAGQITEAESTALKNNWLVKPHSPENYETLTAAERALPGALPALLIELNTKRATLESGKKPAKAALELQMDRIYTYFKTYIDDFGYYLDQEEVETVRLAYQVGIVKLMRQVKVYADDFDQELRNNAARKLMYSISVYYGVENWPGKDDGWSKPKPVPIDPVIDEEDEEEGNN